MPRIPLLKSAEEVDGVDEAALDLDAGRGEPQVVVCGQRGELEPGGRRRALGAALVRRSGGRDEEHAFETEGVEGLGGDREVRDVRRVKLPPRTPRRGDAPRPPRLAPHLPVAPELVLDAGELLKRDRAPGVQLLGRDADLGARGRTARRR